MSGDGQVNIAIIGTGNGTGGGVAPTPDGTLAKTPDGQPNLMIRVITPAMAILVRFINLYLKTFVGLLTADGIGTYTGLVPKVFAPADFGTMFANFAWISLVVAGIGAIKDTATIMGRVEGKFPLLSGSI